MSPDEVYPLVQAFRYKVLKEVPNRWDAEDILSQCALAVLEQIQAHTQIKNPHALVYTILLRLIGKQRKRINPLAKKHQPHSQHARSNDDSPFDLAFTREMLARINNIDLSPAQRNIIDRYLDGNSFQDLAADYGATHVQNARYRAIAKIREHLNLSTTL